MYPRFPLSLRTEEKQAVDVILDNLRKNFIPVAPAECADLVSALMVHFWDSNFTANAVAGIQKDWYNVLRGHSASTIDKAKLEWLRTQKKKPSPAEILALCDAIDETPRQIVRLKKLRDVKVKDPEPEFVHDAVKILGCPVRLGKMMQQAKARGIEFSTDEQDEYLLTGVVPEWVGKDER